MLPDYFKGDSRKYFGDRSKPKKSTKVEEFKISKRYKKRDMRVEIVEYEIKD
ncbi:MAG: hypothetical protein PQ975_02550 [Methanobacterium sp.]|jgi:hypothetical protein